MILVTEAGYHGMVAFSASSTLPVSASINRCASAWARRGAAKASTAARTNPFSAALRRKTRRGEEKREVRSRGTIRSRSFAILSSRPASSGGDSDAVLNGEGRVTHIAAPARTAVKNLYRLCDPEQSLQVTN